MSEELIVATVKHTLDAVLPPLHDRISALIAAGDELAGFAEHDRGCTSKGTGSIYTCGCGYLEAQQAWREARDA